ncbi:hypothetical protein [Candidatus Phytoplasma oryzae]|nr:hypothetical protein [Candidatus Phytoplasma oryzae]
MMETGEPSESKTSQEVDNLISFKLDNILQTSEIFQFNNACNHIDYANSILKKFSIKLNDQLDVHSLKDFKEKFSGFYIYFFIRLKFLWYIYSQNEKDAHVLYVNYSSEIDPKGNIIYIPSFRRFFYISLNDKIKEENNIFFIKDNERIEIYCNSYDTKNFVEDTLSLDVHRINSNNLFQIFLDFDIQEKSDGLYLSFILYKHGFTELNCYSFKIDFSLDTKIDFFKQIS